MRRILPLLLLMGCTITSETFPSFYADRWCETFDEQCNTGTRLDICRNDGRSIVPVDPRVDCLFRQTVATTCLQSPGWTCEDETVVVPEACFEVYDCDEDPG